MTGAEATLGNILSLCVDMERTVAELYRTLAEQHRRRTDLCKLWAKTACEEDGHAAQFERALALEDAVAQVRVSLDDVAAIVARAREALERVRRVGPSPCDALRLCVKLEHEMAHLHLSQVAAFSEPKVQRLFDAMAKADQTHVTALEEQLRIELAHRPSRP